MTHNLSDARRAILYWLPMAAFLVLTALEGALPSTGGRPSPFWYPLAYTVKVVVVAVLAWCCRSAWRDLRNWPSARGLVLAVGTGMIVALLWVVLDGHYPELPLLGKRSAFDPRSLAGLSYWGFLTVRLIGLVLLVPLVEELFWRSFLMRWVIDPEFTRVPLGQVTPSAMIVTSGLFGLVHPEWLPGLITGLLWSGLLWKTRSVSACVVSHMVANLALGVYVIAASAWKFW